MIGSIGWRRWVALLDTREPASALAASRMVVAATVFVTLLHAWLTGVASSLWVAPELGGVGPNAPGLLRFVGGASWPNVRALLLITVASSGLLGLGLFTRPAAAVTWLGFHTLAFLNPLSGGSGDDVVSNVLFLIMLSGAGKTWSLDARWFGGASTVTAWPRYLLIGQMIAIYTAAGWHKMSASWLPVGSLDAVWYSLTNPIWQRRAVAPSILLGRVAQAATLTTWMFEVSAPLLLVAFYFRATADRTGRWRRWFNRWDFRARYLMVGFCLHLGIELTMEVGAFFGGMMALYAACLHPVEWQAIARRARWSKGR
jgi:hypothetical protein